MRRIVVPITILLLLSLLPGVLAAQTPGATPATVGGAWRIAGVREIGVESRYVALSPDGQWLAGVGTEDALCVWDVATLTPACADERLPIRAETIVWSPDSTAVAFALDTIRLLYESDIYVYEQETGKLSNLTDDGVEGDLLDTLDSNAPADDVPAWSPDSQQLAFARSYRGDDEPGSTSIMRIDRAGGEPVELLPLDVEQPLAVWSPMTWLPDGTLLYAQSTNELGDPRNGIWKVGIDDGASPLQIAPGARESDIPGAMLVGVDADSGQAIVFSYLLAGQVGASAEQPLFWLVDIALAERTPFPNPPGAARVIEAGYSPDGGTVLLVTISPEGSMLMTMDPATGAIDPLEAEPQEVVYWPGAPQWAANDTVLLQVPTGPRPLTLEPAT